MPLTSAARRGVLLTKCVSRNAAVARSSAVTASGERLADDFGDVLGELLGVADALQLLLCGRFSLLVEALPAVERARHARRDLRIERVQRDDLVGEERVAF